MPNFEVRKIDDPIKLPISLGIVTIVHWYQIIRIVYVTAVK